MTVCACLGLLKPEQAKRLKEAGVDRYNHNINTSEAHHESITTSHTFDDRVNTVDLVKAVGYFALFGRHCRHAGNKRRRHLDGT